MAKAHRLPLRHHARRALAHCLQQGSVGVAGKLLGVAAGRVVAVYHVVSQFAQLRQLVAVGKVLKMSEPNKALRHACHHGSSFYFFTAYGRIRPGDAQRARGR